MPKKRKRVGYNTLKDSDGRPLKVRAPVRNRIMPQPGGERQVYKRTIVNISWAEGTASWLLEDIDIQFRAVGYAKFPNCIEPDVVALEVVAGKDKGWVRVDKHSVEYGEAA
jgi:hypothetical protein